MAQTVLFQIVPDSVKVAINKLLTGVVTFKGATAKPGYIAMDGTGGLYVTDIAQALAGGFQWRIVASFPDVSKVNLLVKDKTACLAVENSKFKVQWLTGADDEYNMSTDQINGQRQLEGDVYEDITDSLGNVTGKKLVKPAKKHTLDFGYDPATGMVTMAVDGVLDKKRYRFQEDGELNTDLKSGWQFLVGMKANVYSITAWSGKPTLVPAGIECYAIDQTLHFRRIDPAMVGAEILVISENPNGASANSPSGKVISTADFTLTPQLDGLAGVHTIHLAAVKAGKVIWTEKKMLVNRPKPALPPGMVKGIYHVKREDFQLVRSLGANHLYCDFTVNHSPAGWQEWPSFLQAAQAAGLNMLVAASYHAKAGTFPMGDASTATSAWYSVDEAAGTFDRLRVNYLASRMAYPTTPVIVDLNNFTRIEEAAECCDVLMVNVYLAPGQDRRKITDVVRKASALRPTWLVLPLYEAMKTPQADLVDMARIGKEAGATGIWIFEFDHRAPDKPNDWYMPAEFYDRIRAVFAAV